MKQIKMLAALCAAVLVMLTAAVPAVSAATEGFDGNNCQSVVNGENPVSQYVSYYAGSEVLREEMTWVEDEERGTVLSLDGTSQYLTLSAPYGEFNNTEMSFSTWINFKGAVDKTIPTGAIGQYLFSLYSSDERYFEVSPYEQDLTTMDQNGFSLNGLCSKFYRTDGGEVALRYDFTPVQAEYGNTALPEDEWHHVAVVIDSVYMQVYVDGTLVIESVFGVAVSQMYASHVYIGRGHAEGSYLHALLDDTMVFDKALTAEQVAALMVTDNPAMSQKTPEEIAALPQMTTTTMYMPTTTQTLSLATTTNPNAIAQAENPMGLPLPVWGYALCVGILGVLIIICVIVNIYEFKWRKANRRDLEAFAEEHNMTVEEVVAVAKEARMKRLEEERQKKAAAKTKKKNKDGEPELSIKEAAKKKRKEDEKRFLEEEGAEEGGEDNA